MTKITNEKTVADVSIPMPQNSRKPCPLDWAEASCFRWIYVALWWWIYPILKLGYQRPLTEDDLFDVSPKDECGRLLRRLETVCHEHETKYPKLSIWKMIIKTFWKEGLLAGLILIPYGAAKIAQPLFLKQIVLIINDPDQPSYAGYLFAAGLGLASILQALMHQQLFFRTTRVGNHMRVAISSLIYKRLLSLPTRAIMKTTTGQVINLISNDAGKFEELSVNFHHLWAAPLEAAVIFGLVWNEIGVATLFGYGVLLLLVPLQMFFSRKFGAYRKNTVQWTDKRVKVINEILVGCQIVKMYRWEEALEDVVYHARKNEFKSIRKASRIRAINMGIFFSSLTLVSLATFGGSWLMGKVLAPAQIFTVLSLFSIVRYPLTNALPYGIEKLSESVIASKRINEFLNLSKNARTKTVHDDSVRKDGKPIPGTITMEKASFYWDIDQKAGLVNIDLQINQGTLVGIIGPIGSYKSSLLAAILGEMSLVHGYSQVQGAIAYVSQTPWIFAGTIRENIIFCKAFDQEKYDRVVKSCQLIADLRSFSAGDMTVIGEKGVNLSGGQKARVSLARALYMEADIYLFDDPLAAVDPAVARRIFKECISNESIIKDKTRLLVTHQIQFLSDFDHCVLLDHGRIEKQGSFDDLLTMEKVRQAYEKHQYQTQEAAEIRKRQDSHFPDDESMKKLVVQDKASIVKDETSIGGNVGVHVWLRLFTAGYGWIGFLGLIFFMLVGEGIYDATNKWLSIWSSKGDAEQRETQYPYVYLGLVLGTFVLALIRADFFFNLILCGASVLHNGMFKGVLYSSLRFYESNPVGRILNRFSKDQQVVDEALPATFFDTVQSMILVLGSLVIIGMANPWVLLVLVPIVPIFIWLRRFYLRTSRHLKRLESVTRSPIYALYSSSLSGLMTIRAFNMQKEFVDLFIEKVNANTRTFFIFGCSGRWFGLRLDLLTCSLTLVTAILSVALRNNLDPSAVALGLTYCITLTALFQWGVRQSAETENFMTSTERIDEYSHLPAEPGFYQEDAQPPKNWPVEGRIQFEQYKLRYRPELEPVLKGLNLDIASHNKIGVIGRTGAGKSSIFQALFRLTDRTSTEGKIFIDGVDIHTISLRDLRSVLNIIPQSPVLFSNTLRYNLDPFSHYTDEQLWDALEAVQLKAKIDQLKDKLQTQVAEYGSNFSVGECQLICVARAILKQSKILLIDEATAHVDTRTDQLIQKILREKFSNQTILTIAHRLNTVLDSDKIVIMDNGLISEYATPAELLAKHNPMLADMDKDNAELQNMVVEADDPENVAYF